MSAFVSRGHFSLLTFHLLLRVHSSTVWSRRESGEGMAGRQTRGGGHLIAQTKSEWDKPDPIPVFVPLTGQIPGPLDWVIMEPVRVKTQPASSKDSRRTICPFNKRIPPLCLIQKPIPVCACEAATASISNDVIQNRASHIVLRPREKQFLPRLLY